jgi:hypothetical protein
MGNLVTSATWEHFWLNEGFTMMVERKIIGALHGPEVEAFSALLGIKALKDSVEHYEEIGKPEYSALVPDLTGFLLLFSIMILSLTEFISCVELILMIHLAQCRMKKDIIFCFSWNTF